MGARHADRIWAAAGGFGALVLLAVGWFLLIGPQKAETEALRAQVTGSHDQAASLQRKLADLKEQQRNKPRYEAELEADRKALPAFPSTTDFVRQMRAAGARAQVTVKRIAIGEGEDDGNGVFRMSITLSAEGERARLDDFLDQIQRIQPRAQLVNSVSLAEVENEGDEGYIGPPLVYTLEVGVDAFVAPAAEDGQ